MKIETEIPCPECGTIIDVEQIKETILMCGGFERSATTEKKFKVLADELAKQNIASLRFDYSGCGLSDGDFSKTTIQRMANDFRGAVKTLQEETKVQIKLICLTGMMILSQKMKYQHLKKIPKNSW